MGLFMDNILELVFQLQQYVFAVFKNCFTCSILFHDMSSLGSFLLKKELFVQEFYIRKIFICFSSFFQIQKTLTFKLFIVFTSHVLNF